MNKLLTAIASITLLAMTFASAEIRVGASVGFTQFEADGTETLKSTSVKATKSHDNTVMVPALFLELGSADKGIYIGMQYTDVASLGQKSKVRGTTPSSGGGDNDTGVNSADADVESLTALYLIKTLGQSGFFVKLGQAQADITTKEQLATGSTYGNVSVDGLLVGAGFQKNSDNGYFFRATAEHIDYDDFTLNGSLDADSVRNVIKADVDSMAYKIAFGKAF